MAICVAMLNICACSKLDYYDNMPVDKYIKQNPDKCITYTTSNNEPIILDDSIMLSMNIVYHSYGKYGTIISDKELDVIPSRAFSGCRKLKTIAIPNSVTEIGSSAFSYCTLLTDITIPQNVSSIGDYAFSMCYNLTEITIPGGVKSMGEGTFSSCYDLTKISIQEGVKVIGHRAFTCCSNLTEVAFPKSVTEIGAEAFYYCEKLQAVYCKPTSPPFCQPYAFHANPAGRKIYVPRNSVDAYKSYWSHNSLTNYGGSIVGYDF